jgi:hypothetical protein
MAPQGGPADVLRNLSSGCRSLPLRSQHGAPTTMGVILQPVGALLLPSTYYGHLLDINAVERGLVGVARGKVE